MQNTGSQLQTAVLFFRTWTRGTSNHLLCREEVQITFSWYTTLLLCSDRLKSNHKFSNWSDNLDTSWGGQQWNLFGRYSSLCFIRRDWYAVSSVLGFILFCTVHIIVRLHSHKKLNWPLVNNRSDRSVSHFRLLTEPDNRKVKLSDLYMSLQRDANCYIVTLCLWHFICSLSVFVPSSNSAFSCYFVN